MNLVDDLRAIGLTKSEVAVYLFVLEHGVSTPPQISRGTGILRTNCYHLLQSLADKGLVQPKISGKRATYIARDPQALYRSIETKQEAITRLLPDLRALYGSQKNKPKIQFYEGLEQVKEVYYLSLESQEIFGIGSTKAWSEQLPDIYQHYTKEIKKRHIILHDILTHDSKEQIGPSMKELLKGLYDPKYLSNKYEEIPTDILLWDDHLALVTLREPYFATLITNPLLAKTMRTLFQVMYDQL